MSDQIPTAPPVAYQGPEPDPNARMFGMLAHLAGLGGILVLYGSVIGPLIVWLIKKDTMPFVNDQGKEALNFQITMTIAMIICGLLFFVGIGVFLFPVVGLIDLIFVIIASIEANKGVAYRYPFALRLIK